MKIYGESIFDILYLIITLYFGIKILNNKKNSINKLMGYSILILGIGDSFHLIPRVLSYFTNYDLSLYLGIGKLITSITMTIFYIFMYYIFEKNYNFKNDNIKYTIIILSIIRITLCLLPQNNWIINDNSLTISIIRNIPFIFIGLIIILLYYKFKNIDKYFKSIWILVLLSFIFYIPVILFSNINPLFGTLMLPKTICYILIIILFYKRSLND